MAEMLGFIKRRFSSNDLTSDGQESQGQTAGGGGFIQRNLQNTPLNRNQSVTQPYQRYNASTHRTTELSQTAVMTAVRNQGTQPGDGAQGGKKVYPSAPSSPSRSASIGMGSQQGQMGGGGPGNNYFAGSMSQITKGIFSAASNAANTVRDKTAIVTGAKSKILLVIDEPFTDWSKIFRGRKIQEEYDVRVEQAQFSEISISAHSEQGCICNIHTPGNKQPRSFRPDFVLIRQHCSDINHDWSNIITGLAMGQVYGMNSLSTVLHMKNKGWLFAHLLQIRNHLGKDEFPLVSQSYHSSSKELNSVPSLPCVVKIGEGRYGDAKMRIEDPTVFQDLASIAAMNEKYITVENFVDAKCDFVVQKIGPNYRGFMRKSISGSWKANVGSSMLEKMVITEKMKVWVDEIAKLFGGLDVCSVNGVISKTGEYFILGANGSDTQLLGESQEDDKRIIADLLINKWNAMANRSRYVPSIPKSPSTMDNTRTFSNTSIPQGAIHQSTNPTGSSVVQNTPTKDASVGSGSYQTPPAAQPVKPMSNPLPPPPPPAPVAANTSNQGTSYSSTLFNKNQGMRTASVDSHNYKPASDHSSINRDSSTTFDNKKTNITGSSMTQMNPGSSSLFSKPDQRPLTSSSFSSPSTTGKPSLFSQQHQTTGTTARSEVSGAVIASPTSTFRPPPPLGSSSGVTGSENPDENDDTMKNLRKTFAGIFGDM